MPAEAPHDGKRKKKRLVKRTKAITPLQAMMLRMAGTICSYTHDFPTKTSFLHTYLYHICQVAEKNVLLFLTALFFLRLQVSQYLKRRKKRKWRRNTRMTQTAPTLRTRDRRVTTSPT